MRGPKAFAFSLALGVAIGAGVAFVYFDRRADLTDPSIGQVTSIPRRGEALPLDDSGEVADPDGQLGAETQAASSVPEVIRDASANPPFVSPLLMKSTEAAFAAEPLDEEWSFRKRNEIVETLNVIEGGISDAQIECRSSTCRVELVYGRHLTDEDQYLERMAVWEREVRRRSDFLSVRSEYFLDRSTTLSYFSTKGITEGMSSDLPSELPPELAESIRQSIREGAEEVREQAAAEASMSTSERKE